MTGKNFQKNHQTSNLAVGVVGAEGPVIKPLEAAVRMAALMTVTGVVSLVARPLTPVYKTMTSLVMRLSTLVEMTSLVTKPSTLVAKAVASTT